MSSTLLHALIPVVVHGMLRALTIGASSPSPQVRRGRQLKSYIDFRVHLRV